MPKKKTSPKKPPKPHEKITVLVPADWMPAIHAARGEQKLSDFVRDSIQQRLNAGNLSEMERPGRRWPDPD